MSEWQETKLSSLCEGIYDGPHATPKRLDKGPIFLGISSLNQGSIDLSKSDHLSEEDFNKWTRRVVPQENDLVFSYETRLGEAALIPAGLRCCLGRRMALMRPNLSKVNPRFLLYAYLSPTFQATIKSRTVHGSTVNRIPLTEFPDYPILVPSLETQNQIASTLSNLDRKIENLRKQNETLEKIAQTLFKHWFVDFEFPFDFAQGKLSTDGKPYKSSGGAMVPSELGEIPAGWRVGKLGDLFTLNYGKSLTLENRVPGQYLVVGSSGVVGSHQNYLVKAPGIVIGRKGTIGQVIWLEENFYPIDTTFYVKDIFGCENLYFYYFLLKRQNFQRLTSDSAVPGLNRDMAYSVEITIPKVRHINNFNKFSKSIFDKINLNERQIQTLTKTRDTLLPKLMSGKLRVGSD